LVVNKSDEAKQADDSRNYATNQPSKSVQEFKKKKEEGRAFTGWRHWEPLRQKALPKNLT